MRASLEQQTPPTAPESPDASNEIVKLIRKLRWVGMEEEADKLLKALPRPHGAAADSVLATPRDTD